jgi:signal peptidase II
MLIAFFVITASVLAVDLITKAVTDGMVFSLLPDFISVRSRYNPGIALSIGADWPGFGYIVSIFAVVFAVLVLIFFIRFKNKTKMLTIGAALLIAGILGNVIDRWAFGYVRDFIYFDFMTFPVFNIADIAVITGAALFGVKYVFS